MAVAKRQRKWKAHKNGTKGKSMYWSKNFRWNKHTPFLASPICTGQARGEETKKRKPRLRLLFYGWPTLMPEGCTILCLLNETLSCNRAVTLVHHFKYLLWQDRTKEITLSWHIISWCLRTNRKSNRKSNWKSKSKVQSKSTVLFSPERNLSWLLTFWTLQNSQYYFVPPLHEP